MSTSDPIDKRSALLSEVAETGYEPIAYVSRRGVMVAPGRVVRSVSWNQSQTRFAKLYLIRFAKGE